MKNYIFYLNNKFLLLFTVVLYSFLIKRKTVPVTVYAKKSG